MNDDHAVTAEPALMGSRSATGSAGSAGSPELTDRGPDSHPDPDPAGPAPRPALGTRAMALAGFAVPALGLAEQIPVLG